MPHHKIQNLKAVSALLHKAAAKIARASIQNCTTGGCARRLHLQTDKPESQCLSFPALLKLRSLSVTVTDSS